MGSIAPEVPLAPCLGLHIVLATLLVEHAASHSALAA